MDDLFATSPDPKKNRRAKQRAWRIRRDRKLLKLRGRRLIKRRSGAKGKQAPFLSTNEHTYGSITIAKERIVIDLPQRLDFNDNYESTVSYFRILRDATSGKVGLGTLKFHKLEFISPSAALVLASEVDRWNQKIGGTLKANTDSWHPDVMRLLCQMGYFELLDIPKPATPYPEKDTVFLPFLRGTSNNPDKGKIAKELRESIEKIVGIPIKKAQLYEGLSEAITNVGHHAYLSARPDALKQWWLSASYDKGTNLLSVTFYDQGVGIPNTLRAHQAFESIKHLFYSMKDSEKIAAAMELGKTSTGLVERGKGLRNLKEFAKVHRQGRLLIYSIRGLYRLDFASLPLEPESHPTIMMQDYNQPIGGTLIEWSVNLTL